MRRFAALGALLAACARIGAPPGGPPDQAPPQLIATAPESLAVYPDWDDDVELRFDEVVSEGGSPNFGLGTGDLEKLVLFSPTRSVPVVRWHRSRITVRPREGWRPNTVYRVELLPGIVDLRNNRSQDGTVITFTTGAPLPTDTLSGIVVNWETRLPAPRALIQALLLPDSLSYRGTADSVGRFALGPLPRGEYLVYGALDQNSDFQLQPRELFDSVRLAAGTMTAGELWAFRHDTLPTRIQSATRRDSISLSVAFTHDLDPTQRLVPDSVEVILLPDSTRVPVDTVLPAAVYDSVFGAPAVTARAEADTVAARARADSIRADSIARAEREAALGIPGVGRRRPGQRPDTAGRTALTSRPVLFDRVVVRLREPLRTGSRYMVTFRGLRTVSGVSGNPRSGAINVDAPRPARDTTPPDTSARRRDTTRLTGLRGRR